MGYVVHWIRSLVLVGVLVGCSASAPRRLTYAEYASAANRMAMSYSVYTPPGFSPTERLPLVVFLHGAGDDPASIDDAMVGQELDVAISKGLTPRVVLVSPQGDLGFWENWDNGERSYRDWVVKELMPHVQRRYHTQACPEGCHLVGISMGGHGALAFKLQEPALWRSVSVISAPIFSIDEVAEMSDSFWLRVFIPMDDIWGEFNRNKARQRNVFTRWMTPADIAPSTLLFAWARDDREQIRASNHALQDHLRQHHIEARSFEFAGGHNWASWRPIFATILRAQVPMDSVRATTNAHATSSVGSMDSARSTSSAGSTTNAAIE
jgi:enterochelin esterase-like enzyme